MNNVITMYMIGKIRRMHRRDKKTKRQIGGAAHIGLGGNHAAVGALAHAQGVGQLHPFESVDVDT